ncbi:MAG: glycosyltransferase [Candidatus Aegiribacteria sp.]|nr:glycosyltransferase [Candidatus Aegiribacteria sp.]
MNEIRHKFAEKKMKSIIFQLPYLSIDTPSAANVWTKNVAQAFAIAGYEVAIQYLSSHRILLETEKNVRYIGLPVFQTILLGLPKLKALIMPVIQNEYLRQSGGKYNLVAPIGGPYFIKNEKKKVSLVKKFGAQYLHPILEHPVVRVRQLEKETLSEYVHNVANLYDYLMPITTYLRDLYQENGRTKPSLLNPIIVDTNAIQVSEINASDKIGKLLYCGNLNHDEEIHILLNSFSLARNAISSLKLTVLGGTSSHKGTCLLLNRYRTICKELGIYDSVDFLGKLPHKKVISHYQNAHAFLLPRPFRLYSQAGFPSKLGEYLATGKPVITTGTGDIPMYLEDGVSAYIVMDDSPEAFAKKTVKAVSHSKAYDIGQMGAKVAKENFSIEATAQRIESFFRGLNAK